MSRAPTKTPEIRCSHCDGTGKRPLPSHLFALLLEVRSIGRASARQVREALSARVGTTAYNNQLETLRELGLLTRERVTGRDVVYFLPRVLSRSRFRQKGGAAISTPQPPAEENPRREATGGRTGNTSRRGAGGAA